MESRPGPDLGSEDPQLPPPLITPTPFLNAGLLPGPLLSSQASSADLIGRIRHIISRKRTDFSFPPSLVFAPAPTKDSNHYQLASLDQPLVPNSHHPLSLVDSDSAAVVGYEYFLVEYLDVLNTLPSPAGPLTPEAESLRNQIIDTLRDLDRSKKEEWDKQLSAAQNPNAFIISDAHYNRHMYTMLPIVYASLILVLILRFLFNLSRRRTDVVLAGLRNILRLAETPPEQLKHIPRDSRTVLKKIRLDPITTTYVMCPECYALYPLDVTEKTCVHKPTEASEPCGAVILRPLERNTGDLDREHDSSGSEMNERRGRGGRGDRHVPVKTYTHQSFKHWLASMLCRPGMEDIIDDYERLLGRRNHDVRDIWDTNFMRDFPGSAQTTHERSPFFTSSMKQDGRYAFSLSMDSFDPLGNVTAKHSISSTGINMVLLNLPPHSRYKTENIYHAGIIPGPGKPSNEQINHFTQLIVDEFIPLYHHGVRYSKTPKHPGGRTCKCVIAILVTDALAARQVAGFRSVTSFHPCTFCLVTIHDLETLTRPWAERNPGQHRENAARWRSAPTPADRKRAEETYHVRWSPLLELPYWHPSLSTVVDSMHNLYLGIIQDHCRNIWGISAEYDGGDGELRPKALHQRPTQAIASLLDVVRWENDPSKLLEKLSKRGVSYAALWYICLDFGHRRDGNQYRLARRITQWRTNHVPPINGPPGPMIQVVAPRPLPPIDPPDPSQLERARELIGNPNSSLANIRRLTKDILRALCDERNILYSGRSLKSDLLGKLLADVGRPLPDDDSQREEGPVEVEASTPVLGKNVLAAIRSDMEKTVLPSWIEPAPRNWGTTEHGKLSADQWKVLCTIHLPISLISMWSGRSARYTAMLANFMDLVTAVRIASMRVTNDEYIELYDHHIFSYIRGILELYKDAEIKPNHHLSLHLGHFMKVFGPVHAYRTFAFERVNYAMQQMNTNAKPGQLEKTLLFTACRDANLRALLKDETIGNTVEELMEAFGSFTDENRRGSRLSDLRNPAQRLKLIGSPKRSHLDELTRSILLSSTADETMASWINFFTNPGWEVDIYRKIVIHGVLFQTRHSATRDSYITFESGDEIWSGCLDQIFLPSGTSDVRSLLLSVRAFVPLSSDDQEKDPYRLWGFSGGELFYETFLDAPIIIKPMQILGHIAKTSLGRVFGIERPCVHTIPLDQLRPDAEESVQHNT